MKTRNLLVALLLGVIALQSFGKTGDGIRPKLVVGLVVDQMRWDYLYRFYDEYGEGGFKRMLNEGYSFENCQINYIPSITAIGHTFTQQNKTVCLKVYTVADDTKVVNNKDITVDYNGGKYFKVQIKTNDGRNVGAGEIVKFKINGKTTTVKTDNNGIAKIKITQLPKKYTITTTYKDKTYKNKVTVKQVLTIKKITIKKTTKKFTLQAKLKINGKLIKGKKITFKFNGKNYKAKTR